MKYYYFKETFSSQDMKSAIYPLRAQSSLWNLTDNGEDYLQILRICGSNNNAKELKLKQSLMTDRTIPW